MARRLASPKLQIKSRFSVWLRRRCRNIPRLVETISLGGVFLHLSVTDTSVITGKRLFVLLTHQFGAFFSIFSSQERGWNPERNDRQNQRGPSKTVFTVFFSWLMNSLVQNRRCVLPHSFPLTTSGDSTPELALLLPPINSPPWVTRCLGSGHRRLLQQRHGGDDGVEVMMVWM